MIILVLSIALLLGAWPVAIDQKSNRKAVSEPAELRADKKLEREILAVENQFRLALNNRDTTTLDRLLADYYSDSFEGSDRAISKKGTLARCRDGLATYYAINSKRKVTVRVDLVIIEGISNVSSVSSGTDEKEQTWVKRYWTKKDGRWQLVSQTKTPMDAESEK
jgi:Domain of unknown function (DUF4440)